MGNFCKNNKLTLKQMYLVGTWIVIMSKALTKVTLNFMGLVTYRSKTFIT